MSRKSARAVPAAERQGLLVSKQGALGFPDGYTPQSALCLTVSPPLNPELQQTICPGEIFWYIRFMLQSCSVTFKERSAVQREGCWWETHVRGEWLRWAGEGGAPTGQGHVAEKGLLGLGSCKELSSAAGCAGLADTEATNGLPLYIPPRFTFQPLLWPL